MQCSVLLDHEIHGTSDGRAIRDIAAGNLSGTRRGRCTCLHGRAHGLGLGHVESVNFLSTYAAWEICRVRLARSRVTSMPIGLFERSEIFHLEALIKLFPDLRQLETFEIKEVIGW